MIQWSKNTSLISYITYFDGKDYVFEAKHNCEVRIYPENERMPESNRDAIYLLKLQSPIQINCESLNFIQGSNRSTLGFFSRFMQFLAEKYNRSRPSVDVKGYAFANEEDFRHDSVRNDAHAVVCRIIQE